MSADIVPFTQKAALPLQSAQQDIEAFLAETPERYLILGEPKDGVIGILVHNYSPMELLWLAKNLEQFALDNS